MRPIKGDTILETAWAIADFEGIDLETCSLYTFGRVFRLSLRILEALGVDIEYGDVV